MAHALFRRCAPLALVTALAGSALAQGSTGLEHFPLEVGLTWTYRLTISRGGEAETIQFTSRVDRVERLGVAECRVVESRSGARLLQTDWYHLDGTTLRNLRRQNGARVFDLRDAGGGARGRVFLDEDALAGVDLDDEEPGPSWDWETEGGGGTVTVIGREALRLPNLGELDCLVVRIEGRFQRGEVEARQTRDMWLAPGIGMVREVATFQVGEGTVTKSESVLERLPERT